MYEICMLTRGNLYYDFMESYRVQGWNLSVDNSTVSTYNLDSGFTLTIL